MRGMWGLLSASWTEMGPSPKPPTRYTSTCPFEIRGGVGKVLVTQRRGETGRTRVARGGGRGSVRAADFEYASAWQEPRPPGRRGREPEGLDPQRMGGGSAATAGGGRKFLGKVILGCAFWQGGVKVFAAQPFTQGKEVDHGSCEEEGLEEDHEEVRREEEVSSLPRQVDSKAPRDLNGPGHFIAPDGGHPERDKKSTKVERVADGGGGAR